MALNQFGMAMIDIIRFETGIFAMQFRVKKPIISINFMIFSIVPCCSNRIKALLIHSKPKKQISAIFLKKYVLRLQSKIFVSKVSFSFSIILQYFTLKHRSI